MTDIKDIGSSVFEAYSNFGMMSPKNGQMNSEDFELNWAEIWG
jgi:hypothetical protein